MRTFWHHFITHVRADHGHQYALPLRLMVEEDRPPGFTSRAQACNTDCGQDVLEHLHMVATSSYCWACFAACSDGHPARTLPERRSQRAILRPGKPEAHIQTSDCHLRAPCAFGEDAATPASTSSTFCRTAAGAFGNIIRRNGLMRCSGLNSPSRSHQRRRRPNLAISLIGVGATDSFRHSWALLLLSTDLRVYQQTATNKPYCFTSITTAVL